MNGFEDAGLILLSDGGEKESVTLWGRGWFISWEATTVNHMLDTKRRKPYSAFVLWFLGSSHGWIGLKPPARLQSHRARWIKERLLLRCYTWPRKCLGLQWKWVHTQCFPLTLLHNANENLTVCSWYHGKARDVIHLRNKLSASL